MKRLGIMMAALCATIAVTLPVAHAAPPRPQPVVTVELTGVTTIAIDSSVVNRWKDLDVRLAARAPATEERQDLFMPVSQVSKTVIRHKGGWVLVGPTGSKLIGDEAVLRMSDDSTKATLTFHTLKQDLPLLSSSSVRTLVGPPRVKRKGPITTTVRTTRITGGVQLIDDSGLVLMMNGAIGAYALVPGESIGTFTTTLVETTTVTRPKS